MLIHPFTIIAQVVNFLILVFLLWKFLYGPVTRVMDERERRIAETMEEAEKRLIEAEERVKTCDAQIAEIEEKRDQMIASAREEAETRRKELIQEAREEAQNAKARWHEAIRREKDAFLRDLGRRAADEIYAIARKVLNDLASEEIGRSIVSVFSKRLAALSEDREKEITKALSSSDRIVVRSSFELEDEMKETIRATIGKLVGEGMKIEFETTEELMGGIEISAAGHKVAWSIADYLGSLEENLSQSIEREAS